MVITNHRLGPFDHGGSVGAHYRHTNPRQPEAMDPGCVTSRRRTHVAARCYRCTTRVATIFLQNVQKPPEKVYRRARIRCATRRPCHCSELVTFFGCAAGLVPPLVVARRRGSTGRAGADVAVGSPEGPSPPNSALCWAH